MRVDASVVDEADVVQVAVSARPSVRDAAPDWMLYNGYQSWDPAGYVSAQGGPRESWWTVGLGDSGGAGIVAAATEARSCCTKFAVADGQLRTIWCEAEALELWPRLFGGPPGTRWRGEEVRLSAGPDLRSGLSSLLTAGPRLSPVPVGWVSWYHFGPWIRREEVLANAELLANDEYRRLGYRLIQIDDGWQQTCGEWRVNTKFPGGLPAVARELERHGQVAGLWTAPFLVSASADVADQAPNEWFVLDPATGERAIDQRHRAFGPMYVLDASVPAVREHLRELFAGLYEAGIRYFKIDFLYAGAYAGTGALRAGIEAIREGARDAQILASGTPLLPVVGLVEGCRVGPDTATPLYDFETGVSKPTIFGDEVVAVARNVAARSVLHRWFHLDADVALVGGNLTLEQARQLVSIAALSGGPFCASDDLHQLPEDRLALLTNPEVLELVGGGTAQPDWEPNAADRPATHWRREDVLAVFNWDDEATEVAVVAPGAGGARDLWARQELDDLRDGTILAIPPCGVRLLRIR